MRTLILALVMIVAPAVASAAKPPVASGAYVDSLLVGYDPATDVVTGFFSMQQGDPPMFSCIFYLRGKLKGSSASIRTYYPQTPAEDEITGVLTLDGPGRLQIQLPSEHGGCWNVWHFADKADPANFKLETGRPWTAVAVVKSAKAYFYDAPGADAHRGAYVVKDDGVGVRTSRPDWLQVDYVGGAKTISGWLKRSDVYP
jgi:hypothetical protein